ARGFKGCSRPARTTGAPRARPANIFSTEQRDARSTFNLGHNLVVRRRTSSLSAPRACGSCGLPMTRSRWIFFLVLGAASLSATGCGWVSDLKVPFTGGSKPPPADTSPSPPYELHRPLAPGHTLELAVYRNLLSHSRMFDGRVKVD